MVQKLKLLSAPISLQLGVPYIVLSLDPGRTCATAQKIRNPAGIFSRIALADVKSCNNPFNENIPPLATTRDTTSLAAPVCSQASLCRYWQPLKSALKSTLMDATFATIAQRHVSTSHLTRMQFSCTAECLFCFIVATT